MTTSSTISTNKIKDAITLLQFLSHTRYNKTSEKGMHLTATITEAYTKTSMELTTPDEVTDSILSNAFSILYMRRIKVTRCTIEGQDAIKVRLLK